MSQQEPRAPAAGLGRCGSLASEGEGSQLRSAAAARRRRAAELWQSGLSYSQVATAMNVAPGTIAKWLHDLRKDGVDLPRTRPKPWTSDEDQRLLTMLAQDQPAGEISVALGRTTHAVTSRLRNLRATHPDAPGLSIGARVSWTPARDAQLIEQYNAGATHAVIASQLGCTPNSVFLRLRALEASGIDVPLRKPRWTKEQQRALAARYRQGATYKELSAEFGRSHGTISWQLKRIRESGVDLP